MHNRYCHFFLVVIALYLMRQKRRQNKETRNIAGKTAGKSVNLLFDFFPGPSALGLEIQKSFCCISCSSFFHSLYLIFFQISVFYII